MFKEIVIAVAIVTVCLMVQNRTETVCRKEAQEAQK